MYRDGKGIQPNDSTARRWFEQACRAGSTSGCDALGH
jgi:TPR repeat protein